MADIVDGVDFLIRNRSVNGIDLLRRRLAGCCNEGGTDRRRPYGKRDGRSGCRRRPRVWWCSTVRGRRRRNSPSAPGHRWLTQPARPRSPRRSACSFARRRRGGGNDLPRRLTGWSQVCGQGAVVCDTSTVAPATVRGLTPLGRAARSDLDRHPGVRKRLGGRVRDASRSWSAEIRRRSIGRGRCSTRSQSRSSISAMSGQARP